MWGDFYEDIENEKGNEKITKSAAAKQFLADFLSDGKKPQSEVIDAARIKGITDHTLYNAKKEIGIVSKKTGDIWFWKMEDCKMT